MEFINKIEILGTVGNVRIIEVGDRRMARVSIATDYCYTDKSGAQCIDVTWHNAIIWEGANVRDIDQITKGCHLRVTGRIRNNRYIGADGTERSVPEIVVNRWVVEE